MAQSIESRLMTLADELLIGIVEHVESKNDLYSLALTCSRLQALAEPALYQSILVRKGTQALRLFDAILGRPVRASFIRSLQIRYLYTYKEGIRIMNQGLRRMSKLEVLIIEAPCCNDTHAFIEGFESKGEIDYAEYFIFASSMTLESQPRAQVPLQTFTLHSHNETSTGGNAFNMGRNAIIFLHPTLRNLTVSCFDIGDDVEAYLSGNPNSTPLESLTFDECNITVTGLAAILSVPKALTKLTLGERMYHMYRNGHVPLGRSPALLLQALSLQKDSLQYLKHIGGRTEFLGIHDDLSMAIFPNMRAIELDTHSILTLILSNSAVPPNLQLRLIRSYLFEQPSDEVENSPLPSILEWLNRVHHLDYVVDCDGREDRDSILLDLWRDKANQSTWWKIYSLVGANVTENQNTMTQRRLRVLVYKRSGFIPPYMYGEKLPEEGVIFDSVLHNARNAAMKLASSSKSPD